MVVGPRGHCAGRLCRLRCMFLAQICAVDMADGVRAVWRVPLLCGACFGAGASLRGCVHRCVAACTATSAGCDARAPSALAACAALGSHLVLASIRKG